MLDRQEQRALELAAFKEKTKQILQTFEVKVPDEPLKGKSEWLQNYNVAVAINNIGVAFPLSRHGNLELPSVTTTDLTVVRAFLLSVKLLAFNAYRGETGQ